MIRLTDKERLVLYGLIRHPELNDIELSGRMNIKRPTVTAIRNRLEDEGVYETKRIPDLTRLGCEIITAVYTQYNPLMPYETRKKTKKESQNTFLEIQTDTQQLTLNATKNYTQARKQLEEHIRVSEKLGYCGKRSIKAVFFPLQLSVILMNCDFGPLVKKLFSLHEEDAGRSLDFARKEPVELTEHEKLVLYALVKYPCLKEKEIAGKTLLTRQTVNSINRRLRRERLIKTVRVPDMGKLGLELLVFTHVLMEPMIPLEERMKAAANVVDEGSQVFIVSNLLESMMVSFSRDYTSIQKTYRELMEFYTKNNFLEKRPKLRIIPVGEIKCLKCDYAEATRNLLNVETVI